jgi:fucose 4-O-acetylase-like acetyltransferase
MSVRNKTIDIAKGILILLVVLGHSGAPFSKYIYWFHMPAFFMIAGFFAKDFATRKLAYSYLQQKLRQYLVLYISYFILLFLLKLFYTDPVTISFSKTVLKFIIGGRFVGAELGAFWFLTCLFFAISVFTLIRIFVHGRSKQFAVFAVLYFVAHVQSFSQLRFGINLYVPWGIDISLMGACYLAIGYHMRDWLLNLVSDKCYSIVLLAMAVIVNGILIGCDMWGIIDYRLNMKEVYYNSIFGDIFIPVAFFLTIIALSALIEDIGLANLFCRFGYYSVVIMLLHMSILGIYMHFFTYQWDVFFLIGSLLPLVASFLFDKNRLTRAIFIRGSFESAN